MDDCHIARFIGSRATYLSAGLQRHVDGVGHYAVLWGYRTGSLLRTIEHDNVTMQYNTMRNKMYDRIGYFATSGNGP